MNRTIPQDVLTGIALLLEFYRPDLVPLLAKIVSTSTIEDPSTSSSWMRGATVATIMTATVSPEDGETILKALLDYDHEHGNECRKFNGLTIDGLIPPWRKFVAETPPQSP
jgi:hypothetical protein